MQYMVPVKVFRKKLSAFALLGLIGCSVSLPCYSSNGAVANQRAETDQALTDRSKDKTRQLIKTLKSQLRKHPQNSRIRLKLAGLYYREQAFSEAEKELKRVLADDKLPKKVRLMSEKYLAKVQRKLQESKPKRHTLRGGVQAFIGSDSNANVAPGDTVLDIGILPESSISREDEYKGASIYLLHQYRLSETMEFDGKPIRLLWKSGINAFSKDYSVEDTSDLTVTSLYTGINLKQSKSWNGSIRLKMVNIGLNGKDLADHYSILPDYTHLFGKLSLTINASYTRKEYVESIDRPKEGNQIGAGIFVSWPLLDHAMLRLGAEMGNSNLNQDWRSYDSVKYSLRLNKKINPAFSINLSASYENNQYVAVEPNYTSTREDDILATTIGMKYKFRNNIYLGMKYLYTERDSNNDIHCYDRNRLEAFLGYSF
jgi:tetratricopeptide (TPR) repeat protein